VNRNKTMDLLSETIKEIDPGIYTASEVALASIAVSLTFIVAQLSDITTALENKDDT